MSRLRPCRPSGRLALEERRDLVYRDAVAPLEQLPTLTPPVDQVAHLLERDDTGWRLATDSSTLMRFSSATSNGHRIHVDHPYATQVEGYPGLVVHGPLMTMSLVEVARREFPDSSPRRLVHRNLRPLFCGTLARICVMPAQDAIDLVLSSDAGDDVRASIDF